MDAIKCLRERRSVRSFTDKPVDAELIKSIVETASYAPSWKHTQITRYIAVTGELKDKIGKGCYSAYPHNGEIACNAPVLMAVCVKEGRSGFERDGSFSTDKGDRWQNFDAGVATQTFCLAAHEAGLGTVIQGIFDEAEASVLLGLPDDMQLMCLIPMGYPAEEPSCPKRKAVDDLLTFME